MTENPWIEAQSLVQESSLDNTHSNELPSVRLDDSLITLSNVKHTSSLVETVENFDQYQNYSRNACTAFPNRILASCTHNYYINPDSLLLDIWYTFLSLAILYNLWIPVFRYAFYEINEETRIFWLVLDLGADVLYLIDIVIGAHVSFLQNGILIQSKQRIRRHYINSSKFSIDILALIPLELLYFSFGFTSILRVIKLVKVYRLFIFAGKIERNSSQPNLIRIVKLVHSFSLVLHWNTCLLEIISNNGLLEIHSKENIQPNSTSFRYWDKFYHSTTILTLSNHEFSKPKTSQGLIIISFEHLLGLVTIAMTIGYISNQIMNNIFESNRNFQNRLDKMKRRLEAKCIPSHLRKKAIRWYDYIWTQNDFSNYLEKLDPLEDLPQSIRSEIVIYSHLHILKKVDIFQGVDEIFLSELVLQLKTAAFAPGDFVCRKGEIGREMFIVDEGLVEVLTEDGYVKASLKPGCYFDEVLVLNCSNVKTKAKNRISTEKRRSSIFRRLIKSDDEGENFKLRQSLDQSESYEISMNRRMATVRSVGYSKLLKLHKDDLWRILDDFTSIRKRLQQISLMRRYLFINNLENASKC